MNQVLSGRKATTALRSDQRRSDQTASSLGGDRGPDVSKFEAANALAALCGFDAADGATKKKKQERFVKDSSIDQQKGKSPVAPIEVTSRDVVPRCAASEERVHVARPSTRQADLLCTGYGAVFSRDDAQHNAGVNRYANSPFSAVLMELVSDPQNSDAIVWSVTGREVIILCPRTLVSQVLPRYFLRSTQYASFTRQLHRYGFRQVTSVSLATPEIESAKAAYRPIRDVFKHELFLRDEKELCFGVRLTSRKVQGGNAPKHDKGRRSEKHARTNARGSQSDEKYALLSQVDQVKFPYPSIHSPNSVYQSHHHMENLQDQISQTLAPRENASISAATRLFDGAPRNTHVTHQMKRHSAAFGEVDREEKNTLSRAAVSCSSLTMLAVRQRQILTAAGEANPRMIDVAAVQHRMIDVAALQHSVGNSSARKILNDEHPIGECRQHVPMPLLLHQARAMHGQLNARGTVGLPYVPYGRRHSAETIHTAGNIGLQTHTTNRRHSAEMKDSRKYGGPQAHLTHGTRSAQNLHKVQNYNPSSTQTKVILQEAVAALHF